MFETTEYFVYAMEHAPFGDLASHVGSIGIPESCCKKISDQLSSALGFMHSKNLVHRDLKLENILVFNLGMLICGVNCLEGFQKIKMEF